jgi:phage N-6-adenine-methyltransferase
MMLAGFRANNHPQQTGRRGADAATDDRGTDPADFARFDNRFGFTIDVAASAHNAKCSRYFTAEDDGLTQSWGGERVWCNPPYSDCRAWVTKAWDEWCLAQRPNLIVMLLPANRVEQAWWQDLIEPRRDRNGSPLSVEFLRGRMRFDRPPFGCCLVIWQ